MSEGKRWTRADFIHLTEMLTQTLRDVDEGEIGYEDAEALILRAFADVGRPLVPTSEVERLLSLQESTERHFTIALRSGQNVQDVAKAEVERLRNERDEALRSEVQAHAQVERLREAVGNAILDLDGGHVRSAWNRLRDVHAVATLSALKDAGELVPPTDEKPPLVAEVERLESKVVVQETGWKSALAEVERLRTALKDEIRWNIEGTGIHPDDREGVIERHYQEALHPHEKEKS